MKLKAKRTAAYKQYSESLQSVLSCVTNQPLVRRRSEEVEEFFLAGGPTRLTGCDLLLGMSQYFHILDDPESGECTVRTASYTYEILDFNSHKDLFCFHWEPHSKVKYPHTHLGFGVSSHGLPIDNKAHIPSGRVALEDVVEFLINDLGVKPLKKDWVEIIEPSRSEFHKIKHWK